MAKAQEQTPEPEAQPDKPTRQLTAQPPSKIKIGYILVSVALIAIVLVVAMVYMNHQNTNRDIAAARIVSDKVIADMAKQDTAGIRALGDSTFQKNYSANSLDDSLTFHTTPPIKFSELYGDSKPTLTDSRTSTDSDGKHVSFLYTYHKLKVPFLVKVDITQAPGTSKWTLNGLSAAPGPSSSAPDPNTV